MSKAKILVTGSNGQLGRELQVISRMHPELDFIFFAKGDLPIHQPDIVRKIFADIKPQYCINCAAYTAVDRAETEKEQAYLINGASTGTLAEICKIFDVKFLHISTDYVFNGMAVQPYNEEDRVEPVNTYGASKLQGEVMALDKNEDTVIIRTSWVYSEFGNNFVKTMIRLMTQKEFIGVVNDQSGSPTYAADLAKAAVAVVHSKEWKRGIFHYSNEGIISWFDFANAIKNLINSSCTVNPISTADFPTPAKRPGFSGLNKDKIKSSYGIIIPHWRESLEKCIHKIIQ